MPENAVESGAGNKKGEKAVCFLYAVFFFVWCMGLVLGVLWNVPDQPLLLELPLWFWVGCVFSYLGISVALGLCVKRCFQ